MGPSVPGQEARKKCVAWEFAVAARSATDMLSTRCQRDVCHSGRRPATGGWTRGASEMWATLDGDSPLGSSLRLLGPRGPEPMSSKEDWKRLEFRSCCVWACTTVTPHATVLQNYAISMRRLSRIRVIDRWLVRGSSLITSTMIARSDVGRPWAYAQAEGECRRRAHYH